MPRAACAALAALAGLAAACLLLLGARAQSGVPIPAEAGSEWEIAAGYNTASHSVADGDDRHAIDLVRLDAATGGSTVLAPASGVVSYTDGDCLAIRDAAAMEHLLCHIQPRAGLQRGSRVAVGQAVGAVWHGWNGGNGGFPHIHYALHHSRGGGYLGPSVPFSGAYAIEGVELPDGDGFNLHSGTQFTSTNRANWEPPNSGGGTHAHADERTAGADSGGSAAALTAGASAQRTITGGWRGIAVDRPTTIGELWEQRGAVLAGMFYWDRLAQGWRLHRPGLPGGTDAANTRLAPGDAVIASVKAGAAWLPLVWQAPAAPNPALQAGWNLVSWHGPDQPVDAALGGLRSLVVAFLWDNQEQRYLRWSPGGPAFINSLETVSAGGVLWIQLEQPETWAQQP